MTRRSIPGGAIARAIGSQLVPPERFGLAEALPALLGRFPSGLDAALMPAIDEGRSFKKLHCASLARVLVDVAQYRLGHRRIVQRAEQILQFAQAFEKCRNHFGGKNRREELCRVTQLLEGEAQAVALLHIERRKVLGTLASLFESF